MSWKTPNVDDPGHAMEYAMTNRYLIRALGLAAGISRENIERMEEQCLLMVKGQRLQAEWENEEERCND